MTWLRSVDGSALADILALRPDLAALIAAAEQHAAAALPGRLRELCAIRAAQLAGPPAGPGDADDELAAAVRSWPGSAAFTEVERAVLGLCEQFVLDAHGITDADVAEVQQHLSAEGVVALFANLALIDGFTKFHRLMTTGGS
jgi:alkylhydroperoxidase family enzyme